MESAMESTGQNFFVSKNLSTEELYPNWEVSILDNNPSLIDFEDLNVGEFAFSGDQPVSDGEGCLDQSTNAAQTVDEFSLEIEELLFQEEVLNWTVGMAAQSAAVDELSGNDVNGMKKHENGGATEDVVVGEPRPVVLPDEESIGVTLHKRNKQYEAHLWLKLRQLRNNRRKKGMQLFLGAFMTEYEAKQTHDRAAIKLNVRENARGKAYALNFPESSYTDYMAEHSNWSARDFLWKLRKSSSKFNKGKSRMKGVTVRKSKKCGVLYEAKIGHTSRDGDKVTFNLGKFESEDDAGMAYDRALLFLKGSDELTCITNFWPSRYCAAEIQKAGTSLVS